MQPSSACTSNELTRRANQGHIGIIARQPSLQRNAAAGFNAVAKRSCARCAPLNVILTTV
jgi:hypothetical protein